jgi:hypothetical protein
MEKKKRNQFLSQGMALVVFMIFIFSGCATIKPMSLNEKNQTLDITKESVALMTLRTSNQNNTSYQPFVKYIFIWSTDEEKKKYSFKVDDPYNKVKDQFNEYMISISLPHGKYKIREAMGTSGIFPFIGTFAIPVYADLEVTPNKVVYLGRIDAVVRKRKDANELRAGGVIPLIDQAATGFSTGTFDIKIFDNYEEDLNIFKQKYPALQNYTIEKIVFPPWKKPSEDDMK